MIRKDLVDRIYNENPHLDRAFIEDIVIAMFDQIIAALLKRERVVISNFGRFENKIKRGRLGRNPRTGEPHEIKARYRVSFYACRGLQELVKSIAYPAQESPISLPKKGSRGIYEKTRMKGQKTDE